MTRGNWVEDTIAAIATPLGEGGIGIVRVSGTEAISLVDQAFVSPKGRNLASSRNWSLNYGWILDGAGEKIDEVIVSVMRAPSSYTRENVVEINCHGGLIPLQGVLERVLELGARLAEPGEFTKRAFLHGRLDLSQAEAVIDVIRAKTDRSHRLAVRQLEGGLSEAIRHMRQDLIGLLAAIEAGIDYPDEVGDIEPEAAMEIIEGVEQRIGEMLVTADTGRILREGIDTAIVGRPNVGKSSLLNLLVRGNRAIVTEIPGTTRDVIEEIVNIGGFPFVVRDTAGIRHTEDVIEKIGVERAIALMEGADLVLCVVDGSSRLEEEDVSLLEQVRGKTAVLVANKSDLGLAVTEAEYRQWLPNTPIVTISALTGQGLAELEEVLVAQMIQGGIDLTGDSLVVTRARHKQALKEAKASLGEACRTLNQGLPMDLVAVDIRGAAESLGEVTGDTVRDEVINRIFADFCIGK
ncbi:MAG: tRNA uridine-5-carboxymethylaminomethyl(34) synthesis GTPase MnmE [Firmicutes bacterium]|nr:tRNA uridine-5-carboxymethylaminomethyl(34) synthesis GTPase MnmE [Bacillota bacterium]